MFTSSRWWTLSVAFGTRTDALLLVSLCRDNRGSLRVCGVYIYNQGSQLNAEIKQWDVKVLMLIWQIHPDKRHLDKVAAKEFWRYFFAFMKVKLR
ncbi:unnamed protein product [Peronospora destructor]|uniref:Defective in cullin neddylation protein n=1 Tax=Peronospora destructor TaxID=86335 RepID=A0AAV0UB15_9STRA|nr:unnamed protein product [Peronospora destructor]